jgi:D-methionine transport system permease protein
MDKFMQQMREAFANEALWKEFQTGIWDTIYSTVAATLVACVLGIILGIILVAGEEDGVRPLPGPVMKVLCHQHPALGAFPDPDDHGASPE